MANSIFHPVRRVRHRQQRLAELHVAAQADVRLGSALQLHRGRKCLEFWEMMWGKNMKKAIPSAPVKKPQLEGVDRPQKNPFQTQSQSRCLEL